ncbi:DUF4386 domain-containing protein [Saccharothrix isguenensis]
MARVAGVLYLLLAVLNGAAQMYVRARVVRRGDAAGTAANVVQHATLFRLGFVANLVGIACLLFVAMALYRLLGHVDRNAAAVPAVFVAIAVALMSASLINHFAALVVATNGSFAAASGVSGSDALVLTFLDLHRNGYLIAQVFFGLWLLPLGYLVRASGWFPRPLGVLLVVGCFGYVVDLLVKFLFPGFGTTLSPFVLVPVVAAELWMIGCLFRIGVRKDARPGGLVPVAA